VNFSIDKHATVTKAILTTSYYGLPAKLSSLAKQPLLKRRVISLT